jgi:hypothetical protein
VSSAEVTDVVLEAIARAFGDRQLDSGTARRGLAAAAFHFIQLELAEASKVRPSTLEKH